MHLSAAFFLDQQLQDRGEQELIASDPPQSSFFLSKRNNSKRNKRNRVDIERIVGRLTSVPAICRKALPYSPGYLECLKEERYM